MLNKRRDATSGAFSAFRVSEWSVRRKIVAVLAIPVLLAAVFGGLRVSSELRDASDYSTYQQRASVLAPTIAYLDATERLALPSSLSDHMGDGKVSAQDSYTAAANNLKQAASQTHLTTQQSQVISSMMQIGDTLAHGTGTGITATSPVQLSDMNQLATQLINSTLNTQGTPDPRVQALIQSLNGRLSLVKQQELIRSSLQESSLLGSVWLAAEIGVEGSALDNVKALVGGSRISRLIASNGTRLGLATNSHPRDLAATPRMFGTYDKLNQRLLTNIDDKLATNAAASQKNALADSAIIFLAIFASLVLALLVARALIVPLRKVRVGALEVANQKLPETVARIRDGREPEEFTPIPVSSHEELGQLARAVDDMHRQAVNLATGEAQLRSQVGAMFVTLSRRNTTLVNQQLALIESLEQDEEDPQRLEQLFSLDHLATRMRRTAESLVILGGTSGRTASFEELSVSDVIHAAVSEVQDYQRVRIDAAPDRMIVGRAASDVVHLMAELIDNALSYSPPGSPVTIQAAEDGGRVEIEIIDNGLGMAGDALAEANESLKNGGEVTVDTARRMGLFVVSRLAEEHGLKVKLRRNSNGGGIIATITLPADVLVSDQPVEYVSAMDAPEQPEPEAPVVEEKQDEEYDPYLERIEEAIAAVTGLPRRRPGQNASGPDPVPTPAAAVSMFDPVPASTNPELLAALEPTPLPGMNDADGSAAHESEPIALPAGEHNELGAEEHGEHEHETLAPVVTADFGADRSEAAPGPEQAPALELVDAADVEKTAEEPAEDSDWGSPWESRTDPWQPTFAERLAQSVAASNAPADGSVEVHDHADQAEHESAEVVAESFEHTADEASVEESPAAEVARHEQPHHDFHSVEVPEQESWAPAYDALDPLGSPVVAGSEEPVAPEPVAPVAEERPEPVTPEPPVRLQIRRPLSATPAASALEGDYVAEADQPEDSPIFGQLRSNWLDDDHDAPWSGNEVDRGWNAAERAETAESEGTTRAGLPVRRPGGRLLPGGVSQEPAKVDRDPEAIRNRLAAHAAGVSRGRAAAAGQPMKDDYAHEETGPA